MQTIKVGSSPNNQPLETIHDNISAPTSKPILHYGPAFMERNRRHRLNLTILQDKLINSPLEEKDDGDDSWYNDDDIHLANLDPLDWKNQDHYDVMGLTSLRWKATDDHIKKAYRKKVLKHHPDKTASGGGKYSDSFFKCIQKSWDVLGDNNKRRQFDSVDPEFDEELPKVNFKGDFFKVYGKCFESNGRFSNKQPVPDLGTPEDTKETVDNFYKFWYSYESWRSFENLDEEDVDSAQSREEKRWLDRKNKAARQKLKKEDNLRITKLIDQAMKADPRIKGFKDAERQDKENKKLAKAAAAQAIIDEAREKVEAEERAKEAILLEAKALRENEKAAKEAVKKAIKREKKAIKSVLKPCLDIEEAQSTLKLEEIFDKLPTVAQLEEFKALLEAVPLGDIKQLFIVFESKHLELSDTSVREKIEKEMQATALKRDQEIELFKTRSQKESVDTSIEWSPKQVSCLIKAVASIVGGNANRWEKIAEYVNHHAPEQGKCATADDCVKMSKKVQQEGLESVQIKQQQNIPKKSNGAVDEPTVRFEEVVDKNAWSAADQAKLEAALKKFPGTSFQKNPNERWNRIAAELPERTKEDIKKRVKDLQEMVKLKKKASKMNLN